MPEKEFYTPDEAASYLGISVMTIYRLLKKGGLPGAKVGSQWRIRKSDLDKIFNKKDSDE
jgi:excisionase family DNA binding protein